MEKSKRKVISKLTWKQVTTYLSENKLNREQRVDLLNYFNKEINAFPFDDVLVIYPDKAIMANGRILDQQQKESFLQGSKAILGNYAFQVIADQVMFQAMKKGIHEAENFDALYFSKVALYFIDLFKKYLQKLDGLN